MTLLLRYYSLNRFHLSLFIILGNLILIWLSKSVLINETVFYNAYSEQLTYDRAIQIFEDLNNISWVSYVFSPVILFIKFSLISLVIYIGIIFNNIQYKVPLGSVFKVVIASDIVFLFAGLTKFLWVYFFAGNYDLNYIGFFYPLSLINIFKAAEVEKIWVYPMQTVNLYHFTYLVLLSYGLKNVCKIEKNDSDKIVLLSYMPALILWITLIMFLTIDILS
jgi:hypothetical protein